VGQFKQFYEGMGAGTEREMIQQGIDQLINELENMKTEHMLGKISDEEFRAFKRDNRNKRGELIAKLSQLRVQKDQFNQMMGEPSQL
jgi:hypothetical protein